MGNVLVKDHLHHIEQVWVGENCDLGRLGVSFTLPVSYLPFEWSQSVHTLNGFVVPD